MIKIFQLIRPYVFPALLYSAVIVLVFGQALLPGVGEMIWGDDIHRAYYFYRQFFNNFLSHGIFPWWNPYTFAGAPFMANPIVNILYPPSWLYVLLPLNIAYSWHIALHLLWAMLGMYTLLRRVISNFQFPISNEQQKRITQLDFGAWVGGLTFGLSGFFTARIWAGHVDVIAAAAWMPWVILAFSCQLSAISKKNIIIAGVTVAMQMFAGYQTMAMLTLEAVGIMTVITLIARRASGRTIIATALSVALSIVLAIGLFAVVLVPQQEFFRQTIRTYSLPYFWNAYGSLTWQSLGQFINPFFFGDQLTYAGPPPNFAEHAFFVGRVGMLLVLGVFLIRLPKMFRSLRSPMVIAFGCTALFGLWVSLGPNAPIDLQSILWKLVPMYKFLRIPPRHLILVAFGLSGLIGLSIASLSTILSSRPLSRDPVGKILQLLPMLFVVFITSEMILYARHFIALKPLPETRHDMELVKLLKQDMDPYRVLTNFGAWAPPRDSFDFDAGMQYGVFNATGYDTMILRPYYEFIDASNGKTSPSILEHDVQIPYLNVFSRATDVLNIKYILHPRGYDPLFGSNDPRFRLMREDVAHDYRLYENMSVTPRFYFQNFKERKVEVIKYSPNEIILWTNNAVGDTLASSEVYYPGWEGFVDGQKVDIIKANNTFRALFVPEGRHTVMYRYNPRIFLIGGVITLITAGIMVFLWSKSYDVRTPL